MTTRIGSVQPWPRLRVDDWTETRDTLHMWTQIVGKVRLAHAPLLNHWWQVTLYVNPRGLTTGPIPHPGGLIDLEFDFVEHVLRLRSSDGGERLVALSARPVADFYQETMAALRGLGIEATISARPNEVDPATPFAEDHHHSTYDPEAAHLSVRTASPAVSTAVGVLVVPPVVATRLVEQWTALGDLVDDGSLNDSLRTVGKTVSVPGDGGRHAYTHTTVRTRGGSSLVESYLVEDMGHVWPGPTGEGLFTDRAGPDAGALVWDFARRHPRGPVE